MRVCLSLSSACASLLLASHSDSSSSVEVFFPPCLRGLSVLCCDVGSFTRFCGSMDVNTFHRQMERHYRGALAIMRCLRWNHFSSGYAIFKNCACLPFSSNHSPSRGRCYVQWTKTAKKTLGFLVTQEGPLAMVFILEIKEVFSTKNFVLPRQYTNGIVAIPVLLLKPLVFTTTLVCVGKDSLKSTMHVEREVACGRLLVYTEHL